MGLSATNSVNQKMKTSDRRGSLQIDNIAQFNEFKISSMSLQ